MLKVMLEHKVLSEHREQWVPKEIKVVRGQRVLKVLLEHKVQLELKVLKDAKVLLEHKVSKVLLDLLEVLILKSYLIVVGLQQVMLD